MGLRRWEHMKMAARSRRACAATIQLGRSGPVPACAFRGPLYAPGFPPLAAGPVEMYVYGRSEYEMLSPVLTCEST